MNDTNPFTPPASECGTRPASSDGGLVPGTVASRLAQNSGNPAIITTAIVAILGALSLCAVADSIVGVIFFLPFSLGPLAITGLLGYGLPSRIPQRILACSSICYGIWFMFMYVLCVTSSSSTGVLGFLFIGLYSLPVLFFFWVAAWAMQLKSRSNRKY